MKLEITKIGEPNRIGRIWSQDSIDKLIYEFYARKHKGERFFGEYYNENNISGTIHPDNISHEVLGIYQEENNLYGEIEPYNKSKGFKYVLGIRSYGTVDTNHFVNHCELISFDLVNVDFKFLSNEII